MTQNNNTDLNRDAFAEYLRMINEIEPSPTSGSEESDSESENESENESEDESEDDSEDESEDESEDDNDYDPDSENYDEIIHVHQLIRDELGQTDNSKKVEKQFQAFEKWLPSVELENYEFSADGTSELWGLYLVDQLYADPNDTGDEEDGNGNLLRHKRAKERRVDIRFDRKILESS